MKILLSVNGRFHFFDLAKSLKLNGNEVKLITTYPKYKVREWSFINSEIITFFSLEILKRLVAPRLITYRSIFQYYHKRVFDLITSIYISEKYDIFVGLSGNCERSFIKAQKKGLKTVLHTGSTHIAYQQETFIKQHELIGLDYPKMSSKQYELILREYQLADIIVVPSKHVQQTFEDNGIHKDKLRVNNYGTDLTKFRSVIRNTGDKFRIISVGSVNYLKGVHHLVEAFVQANVKNSELIFVGKIRPEIKEYTEKVLASCENIRFIGHRPQAELYKYYSNANLFALASMDEGLSLVLIEAMACGLPILAYNNTGAADVVKNGISGKVIMKFDVSSLAKEILAFSEMGAQLKIMGKNARKSVVNGYAWSDFGKREVNIYKSILNV